MSRRSLIRLIRPIVLAAVLVTAAWIVARAPVPSAHASAEPRTLKQGQVVGEGPNRAAVAVKFADGQVESRCVAFSEEEIGGDELLGRSGLGMVMSAEGAVCNIGGEGCPSDDCFCQCTSLDNCTYWAYYQWEGNRWVYSQWGVMADTVAVRSGDMQAWSWGKGSTSRGADPPQVTFDQICAVADNTPTPTTTPTVTNTPQSNSGVLAPPQVAFWLTLQTVAPGQCTALNWQTADAISVTLDGVPVTVSGSQEVCPSGDRKWTLRASNSVDQVTREVSIHVTEAVASQPTSTPLPAEATSTPYRATDTPTRLVLTTPAQRPIVTQGPRPLATTTQQALVPTPGIASSPLQPVSAASGGVPFAPTAEPVPVLTPTPQPTPTRYQFSPLATETPRPRRDLGEGGRPTPTSILLARSASGGSGQALAAKTGSSPTTLTGARRQLAQNRAFTPALLPQYAAYVGTMAVLLGMGWYILRRRQA